MNRNKLFSVIALVAFLNVLSIAGGVKPVSKLIVKKWKMTHTYKGDKEVDPQHKLLMVEFTKKGDFVITAAYEETHKGTYVLVDDKTITTQDRYSGVEKTFTIDKITDDNLVLGGFDGEGTSIECTPLGKSKDQTLTGKEHMMAKRWTIYKTDLTGNLGTVFEFKNDKSFIVMPYGYKVPVASGDWKLTENNTRLIMDMLQDGKHMELHIDLLSGHELVLHDPTNNTTNHFHDEKLTSKDDELKSKIKQGTQETLDNAKNPVDAKEQK